MNIAVGSANVTYLSPAYLGRLVVEKLVPTSSLRDLTSTSSPLMVTVGMRTISSINCQWASQAGPKTRHRPTTFSSKVHRIGIAFETVRTSS